MSLWRAGSRERVGGSPAGTLSDEPVRVARGTDRRTPDGARNSHATTGLLRRRRPSHADKRRAWRRALLGEEIRAVLRPGVTEEEIQATAERLLSLAA